MEIVDSNHITNFLKKYHVDKLKKYFCIWFSMPDVQYYLSLIPGFKFEISFVKVYSKQCTNIIMLMFVCTYIYIYIHICV